MKRNTIKKNFIYQSINEILIIIIPLITSPYISRVLGVENLGVYSLSYSIVYYFQIFCMLGIRFYGTREIAKVKKDKLELSEKFSEILFAHIIISCVSIFLFTIFLLFSKVDFKFILIIQTLNIISSLLDISWFYYGIENFKIPSVSNSLIKTTTLVLILLLVKGRNDLSLYTLIMSMSFVISQLLLWIYLPKYTQIISVKKADIIKHFKPLFLLFIPVFAFSLFHYMDKIMLGIFSTKSHVGYYENADKVINIPLTVIFSFSTIMLSRLASLDSKKDKDLEEKYNEYSFKYLELLAMGICFGMFAVSPKFATIFWGKDFLQSGYLIRVLALTIPFSTYNNIIRTQYLMPHKKDKVYTTIMVVGAFCNLILNYIFVKKYNSSGIAIGTLFSEILTFMISIFVTRAKLDHRKYIKSIIPFLFLGIVMSFIVIKIDCVLSISIISLLLEIAIGFILYTTTAIIYFLIKHDNVFFKIIFSKSKTT